MPKYPRETGQKGWKKIVRKELIGTPTYPSFELTQQEFSYLPTFLPYPKGEGDKNSLGWWLSTSEAHLLLGSV